MSIFLDYLEEASIHYGQTKQVFNDVTKPLVIKLLNSGDWTEEQIVDDFVNKISDYFYTNFQRCGNENCREWTRVEDLVQARFDVNVDVCPQCREDGN